MLSEINVLKLLFYKRLLPAKHSSSYKALSTKVLAYSQRNQRWKNTEIAVQIQFTHNLCIISGNLIQPLYERNRYNNQVLLCTNGVKTQAVALYSVRLLPFFAPLWGLKGNAERARLLLSCWDSYFFIHTLLECFRFMGYGRWILMIRATKKKKSSGPINCWWEGKLNQSM